MQDIDEVLHKGCEFDEGEKMRVALDALVRQPNRDRSIGEKFAPYCSVDMLGGVVKLPEALFRAVLPLGTVKLAARTKKLVSKHPAMIGCCETMLDAQDGSVVIPQLAAWDFGVCSQTVSRIAITDESSIHPSQGVCQQANVRRVRASKKKAVQNGRRERNIGQLDLRHAARR